MKKIIALVMCVCMLMGVIAGCNNDPTTPSTAGNDPTTPSTAPTAPANQSGRTDLNMTAGLAINTFDPFNGTGEGDTLLAMQLYEPLVEKLDGEIAPLLCESWESNSDSTEFTFTIKKGVKFHNGDSLTADDVVYSIQKAKDSATLVSKTTGIDKVEKIGDNKVKITMDAPSGVLLINLCKINIVSKSFAESHDLSTEECGTGPYYVTKHVEQQ